MVIFGINLSLQIGTYYIFNTDYMLVIGAMHSIGSLFEDIIIMIMFNAEIKLSNNA